MKGDILVHLLEKRNAITDCDRQDRIVDLVGQAEPKAFARHRATACEPGLPPANQCFVLESWTGGSAVGKTATFTFTARNHTDATLTFRDAGG